MVDVAPEATSDVIGEKLKGDGGEQAGIAGPVGAEACAAPDRLSTRSTSQLAQRVNPGRNSSLHFGQNMMKNYHTRAGRFEASMNPVSVVPTVRVARGAY